MTLTCLYQVLTHTPVKVKLNGWMVGLWVIILVSISPSQWRWSSQHQACEEQKYAPTHHHLCMPLNELELSSFTMLGVIINDRISADEHVTNTIATCSKSLYALRVLRAHGMPTQALHSVYRATVLSKLLYYNQAWSGFCSAAAKNRTRLVQQPQQAKWLLCGNVPPVAELFADSDNSLLKRVLSNENHALHEMLPPINKHKYNLRKRPHNHQLPRKGKLTPAVELHRPSTVY